MRRVMKGATLGPAVGADIVSRYLTAAGREALIAELSGEAEARAAALIADARAAAAAILADAEADAATVRARAHAEGYAAGHAAGEAAARAEMEQAAAMLRQAAEAAEEIRAALLAGTEEQAIALALEAARRVVGAAADGYASLAAEVVRRGIRGVGGRVLRLRVNPRDVDVVTAEVLAGGDDVPVQADAAVEIGGCIVDVEDGTVDLRLGVQLERITRALLHAA
jgi:flagellar assembly protein FliH